MSLRLELRPRRRIEAQLLDQLGEEIVRAMPHHPIAFLRGGLYLGLAGLWTSAVMLTNGPVGALLPLMADGGAEAVAGVFDGRIVGIVTRSDLVSALAHRLAETVLDRSA